MARPTPVDRAVFLHGQPGAGVQWREVTSELGPDVEAITPDRPGYGHSPLAPGGIYANAEWLAEVLSDGDGGPSIVVAHSWAGAVAIEVARRHPDSVRGLALIASVGPGAITRFDRVLAQPVVGEALIRPMFHFGDQILRRTLARRVRDPARRAELLASMDANRSRDAWRTFLEEQRSLVHDLPAVVEGLGSLTTPTVVVAGTRDRVVPFAVARRLHAELPSAELIAVEGGRHDLHRSHPRAIAEAVHQLLAANPRR